MQQTGSIGLTNFHPQKKHSDRERWICVYPAYINSKKTRVEGRQIVKEKCVENPTYQEIRDVLLAGGFPMMVENKLYSRERSKEPQFRGRIRVQMRNDDGSILNPQFPCRQSILLHIGTMIPKLKSRQHNKGASELSNSSTQSGSSGKGKGKNKNRK